MLRYAETLDYNYEEENDFFNTLDDELEYTEEDFEEEVEEYHVVTEDIVKLYLQQIGEIPLCTPAEEQEYFKRIRQGDEAAKNEFAEKNLRLVVSIAKNYTSSHVTLLDLVQDGNIGLIKAIDKFDETKGFKFSTYATWWIRQAITRGIANTSKLIRLPAYITQELNKYNKLSRDYEQRGEKLTIQDAKAFLGWSEDKIIEFEKLNWEPAYLDAPVGEEKDVTLIEFIEDDTVNVENIVKYKEMQAVIREVLDSLKPREADIISLRFGLETGRKLTLAEIGDRYRVSRERIRQIEAKVLRRLKYNPKLKELNDSYAKHMSQKPK